MLVALYSLPYRPKGLEVELRSKGLALSTPRKVPSSATNTGGFARTRDLVEMEMRTVMRISWFMGFPFSLSWS